MKKFEILSNLLSVLKHFLQIVLILRINLKHSLKLHNYFLIKVHMKISSQIKEGLIHSLVGLCINIKKKKKFTKHNFQTAH